MVEAEKRIWESYLVGHANSKMMSGEIDDLRIGCFVHTVCLLTRRVTRNEKLDKKIKRQWVNRFFQSTNRRTSF